MSSADDPRDASLETKTTLPRQWYGESLDPLSSTGVFLSGLIMVTKNRFLAWPNMVLALNAYINQHPKRTKEGGSGLSSLTMALAALVAVYVPVFLLGPPQKAS